MKNSTRQPTATVSFQSEEEKERFKKLAASYGLNISSYFRLSAMEYARLHPWKKTSEGEAEA